MQFNMSVYYVCCSVCVGLVIGPVWDSSFTGSWSNSTCMIALVSTTTGLPAERPQEVQCGVCTGESAGREQLPSDLEPNDLQRLRHPEWQPSHHCLHLWETSPHHSGHRQGLRRCKSRSNLGNVGLCVMATLFDFVILFYTSWNNWIPKQHFQLLCNALCDDSPSEILHLVAVAKGWVLSVKHHSFQIIQGWLQG